MTIAANLAVLKTALGPKSERDIICKGVAGSLGPGIHEWLDVGVGDGTSLSRILSRLADASLRFNVVGVDPEATESLVCEPVNSFSALRCPIEDFTADRQFDVVNVRQSAHYFRDPPTTLTNLIGVLRPAGRLFVTHWTQDCFLYQLHFLIAEELGVAPTALSLDELERKTLRGARIVADQVEVVADTIDLDAVLGDKAVFDATLKISARSLPATQLTVSARWKLAEIMRTRWARHAVRVNAVLSLTA